MFARVLDFVTGRPWSVIALALLLAVTGAAVTAQRFAITTDTLSLIDARVPWRQDEIAFNEAFPRRVDLIAAVVDAGSPEQADVAAGKLAEALRARPDLLRTVTQPDSGPFFDKNGLLFLDREELGRNLNDLIRQQALLGPLAA
ncbi:MAG: hopanoid biosynthesis-associated RND transporter HpnN, partial [Methylobacteriaceae bacterium]|nr:hopanoid biosynthesis-associated RND transporter HpnN [Methylobacteriaceae bacterium]